MLKVLVVKIISHWWSIKVVARRLDWHWNWWSCKIPAPSPGRCRAVRQDCWFQGVPCLICLLSFELRGQWSWHKVKKHASKLRKKYDFYPCQFFIDNVASLILRIVDTFLYPLLYGSDGFGSAKLFPAQSGWVELVSGCLGCGLQVELGIGLWN